MQTDVQDARIAPNPGLIRRGDRRSNLVTQPAHGKPPMNSVTGEEDREG